MRAPDTRPFMARRMHVQCGGAVAKAVYLAIAARIENNKNEIAWPSIETIAHEAECCESTAAHALDALVDRRALKRNIGAGRAATTYALDEDAPTLPKMVRRDRSASRCACGEQAQTGSPCACGAVAVVLAEIPPKDVPLKTTGAARFGRAGSGVAGSTPEARQERAAGSSLKANPDRGEEDDATRRRNVKAAIDRADVAERRMVAAVPSAPTTDGAGYGVAAPRIVQNGGLVIGAALPHGTQPVTRDPSECEHLGAKLADHDGAVTCCGCGGAVRAAPVAVVIEEACQKVLEDEADAAPLFLHHGWEISIAPPRRPRVARFPDGSLRIPFGPPGEWEVVDVASA